MEHINHIPLVPWGWPRALLLPARLPVLPILLLLSLWLSVCSLAVVTLRVGLTGWGLPGRVLLLTVAAATCGTSTARNLSSHVRIMSCERALMST